MRGYCQPKNQTKVYNWLKTIHSQLFPTECLLCGTPGEGALNLCRGCCRCLPWVEQGCPRCAAKLPATLICAHCQQQPPSFDETRALFWYRPPVSDLILRLKFQGTLAVAAGLGSLMSQHLSRTLDFCPQAIVPVPLHRRRLRERGYNQALEIARVVSNRLTIPLWRSGVDRVRVTAPQSVLKHPEERRRNVHQAFAITGGFREISHVAILDDVMTSGATVHALASALKRHGLARVDVWICARAD